MSTVPALRETYTMRSDVVRCHGMMMDVAGLDAYLAGRVKEWHYDIRRIVEQAAEISGRTGFDMDRLREYLLSTRPSAKYWQAGESLAHCFLEDYWFAQFPYPSSRDARNPRASMAGADMVGFYHRDGMTSMLFGEVKTSGEGRRPPQVVARLLTQMTTLKDRHVQLSLVLWLVQKFADAAADNPGKKRCDAAVDAYVCRGAVRLVGVLIRDTPPDKADLQSAFERLVGDTKTRLDVCALYIPVPVNTLSDKIGDT